MICRECGLPTRRTGGVTRSPEPICACDLVPAEPVRIVVPVDE